MSTEPLEPLTVSVKEACRLLGLGRTSGYALAKRGELPGAIRLGRRIRVSRAVLERALGIPRPKRRDGDTQVAARRHHDPLPARRIAWDALWDKLLQPPRREPAEPEHVPTPEEVAAPESRSRGEVSRQ